MSNLISMVDFVLHDDVIFKEKRKFKDLVLNYANFLKQSLKLEMFVPCGEDGEVLKEPLKRNYNNVNINSSYYKKYQQAKERCLFEGFEVNDSFVYNGFQRLQFLKFNNGNIEIYLTDYSDEKCPEIQIKTIEDLVKYNLTLTATALNQIK